MWVWDGLNKKELKTRLQCKQEGATMSLDPRKTWQYFAHAIIQEDDPAKLTYLMQQLYRALKDQEQPNLA
jgi:IS5 family transposase